MFPGNELSDPTRLAGFSFPVKTLAPEDKFQDWEMGGVALNDPSQGLLLQLWKFTLEVDEDTSNCSVYVEAPTVVKTLLFTGFNISEIAGAFDQNMHPFVAYLQSGTPKIWWWDPTASAQVHTTLPSGCLDLRCSLDDKRSFNVSDSDVVLSYVRGGSLYYRYQRERYEIEHLLKDDITRLVSMAMNVGSRMQWRCYGEGDGSSFTSPFLGDIVYDLCRQAGIPPENIDVSELYDPDTDFVSGMLVDSDDGLDKPISWLMDMFQFDKVEHGGKLRFIKRGRPVVARIPYNKLIDDYPKTLKRTERDRAKLPRTVSINHIDPDGGFAKNKQTASRRSNVAVGTGNKNIDSKVVLTADQAASAALRKLKILHNEYEDFEFSTRLEYTYLTPGDVIEVEDFDGSWYRMHITERNEDDGTIKWEAETDGGYLVYDNVLAPGKPLDPPVSTTPGTIGSTELDIFNIPVNRDAEDELTLHLGAKGSGSGWNGYVLYFSPDGVIPYQEITTINAAANIGETVTAVTDSSTSVEVLMPEPLASVSSGEISAGKNRAILGDEEVQFNGVSLLGMVDGMYHYSVNLVRGVLHSTKEAWSAGIRFAEFDEAIVAVKVDRTYLGSELFYKAVSLGQSLDETTALSYEFTEGVSQREWPVTNVAVTAAAGGGITVTWDGSPRLGTFGPSPYHSKYMIGYRVKFSDGHTIDTTEETVTYPAGLMGTVVEVRALNAITGEGPLADGTGSVDPGELPSFLFSGSFSDGYVGEPLQQWDGEGYDATGGYWDANARGFVVPGVGAKCADVTLDGMRIIGIPHEAGTFTSKVRIDASSPDPTKTGTEDIDQSVTIYPRRSYGALDLRFRSYAFQAKLVVTTPPLKKFDVNGACSLFFYGVDSGKVWGQFRVAGSTRPFIVGINNVKGELTIGDYSIGLSPFGDAVYALGTNATYSIELNADTGDWWIYEDMGSGPVLKTNGNLPLSPGNLYRIGITTEYAQSFIVEANGGNETPYTSVTQVGHTGIPVPATPIPLAWGYVFPDYAGSFTGNGVVGATYGDDYIGVHVAKSNAAYASGKHRWQMHGGLRNGICVAAFDETSGQLGDPGTPDSLGVGRSLIAAGSYTVHRCFGGVYSSSEVVMPSPYSYPQTIFALDADGDTLKICAMDTTGTNVVVLDTIALPSGQTWYAAETGAGVNCEIKFNPIGPAGYADAVVP